MDPMTKWQLELFKDHCHQMLHSFRIIIREQSNASKTQSAAMFFLGVVIGLAMNPMEKYIYLLVVYACFLIAFFIHNIVLKRLGRAVHAAEEITKQNPFEQERGTASHGGQ